MKITPTIVQSSSVISVTIAASYDGALTDSTDKSRIAAYGDPVINIGGTFTDPLNLTFSFSFIASPMNVGLTTTMQNFTARFMTAMPAGQVQGPMDCITTSPTEAATAWVSNVVTAASTAMIALRLLGLLSLLSIGGTEI